MGIESTILGFQIPEAVTKLNQAAIKFASKNKHNYAEKCKDMVHRLLAYGSFASAKQQQFAENLYVWAYNDNIQNNHIPDVSINAEAVESIYTMFKQAKAHGLMHPKIGLQASNGGAVSISVAGNNSKYAGSLMITDGKPFGSNIWYGYIKGNQLHPSKAMTPEVMSLLMKLGTKPEEAAAEYGKLTGKCCFCHKPLTDDNSTSVGYGPVCAAKYGLKWGNKAVYMASPADSLGKTLSATVDIAKQVKDAFGVGLAKNIDDAFIEMVAVMNEKGSTPLDTQTYANQIASPEPEPEAPKPKVRTKKVRDPKGSWFE